jgi:uncharacterized protein (DUF305 family)
VSTRPAAVAVCLCVALGGGACSSEPAARTSTPSAVSAADREFVTDMVPVQQQAVRISKQARTHGASVEVRTLATRIGRSQGGQVDYLRTCLDDWGSAGRMPMMDGRDTGSGSTSWKMMNDLQTDDLDRRRGAAFDGRFLLLMQQHHRAALRRTALELRDGRDPRARELARRMQDQMQGELVSMEGMARAGTRSP